MSGSKKKSSNSSNREPIIHLDPNDIAFSYSKISSTFSGCGHTIEQTLNDIVAGRLKASDLPEIAVLENLAYSPPAAGRSGGGKKAVNEKKESKKKVHRDACEENDAIDMGQLPAAQRYRYFSMNNRRLYVFRRARACGALETVPCRLKPPDVAARLLDPKGKGSRTFRLDRVCDDAKVVAMKDSRVDSTTMCAEDSSAASTTVCAEKLVKASCASRETFIKFDAFSAAVAHTTVEFGLLIPGRLTFDMLVESLEKTLAVFPFAAGRLALREGETVLVGNNAGVPVSHCKQDATAPSFALPLPANLFDVVKCAAPSGEEPEEAALLSLRLTDFLDKQALCISFSHGVMDAASAGMLLATLAAICRGETPDGKDMRFDRTVLPSTPGPGKPPLTERSAAQEAWQRMHTPPEPPELAEAVPMAVLSHVLSHSQCAALKSRMAAAASGAKISTNDALLTELLLACGYNGDRAKLHMVLNLREALGLEGLWGNGVFTQSFSLSNSESAAGDIRRQLPDALAKDYIDWKFSQSASAREKISKGEFRFNSWVKAVNIKKLHFGPGGATEGVSVGLPMWRNHASLFGKCRVGSCIVNSVADGVVMSVLHTRDCVQELVDRGLTGTIVDL